MIFVIDDDEIMAECIARSCGTNREIRIFASGIEAMNAIDNGEIPDLIFLDVLLDGPDGFAFLNELVSYGDTKNIPIVIVTSLTMKLSDLKVYGVVGLLEKDKMTPQEIDEYVEKYAK